MADDQLAPEEGLGPNAAPAEGEPKNNEPNPIEDLASKLGWAPKEQFRGNPDEWKPADEFILASKDINRGLSREVRSMREQIDRLGRTSSQLLADKIAERDAYWQSVHADAVEKGDAAAAQRATNERIKLATEAKPSTDQGEPPETAEFRQRNATWFGPNKAATIRAMEAAEKARLLGESPSGQLEAAEQIVRREFPELFKTPTGKQAPAVATAASRAAPTSSREKGFNDMPAESQKMAREYERRHGIKPEDFAKSYWAEQAKRRVG